MVFDSVTNRLTNSGGAQQDELIEGNAEEIAALQEDVAGLQAALDGGPVETSGPTVRLAPDECEDLGQRIIDEPNARFILQEGGEYPIRTEPRLTDPDQPHRELAIEGNGARIVVADENVGSFGWFGRKAGGCFDRLSLQDLTLVVDPDQGYDAGWGRFRVDDRVENANLSIEGRRDFNGSDSPGDKFGYFCCMTSPSGLGVHRHIDLGDGDTPAGGEQFDHAIGVGVEPEHAGTNLWAGCYLENWWDNGYYVKDGTGRNILLGCEARNCGGTNLRIGHSDVVLGCRSVWDLPATEDDAPDDYEGYYAEDVKNGACFGADDASATTVSGLRIRKETGQNEAVRLWDDTSDQISVRDLHIVNETSQWAVAIRGTGDGTATFDNLRVLDRGGTSVRGASVLVDRFNAVLEDPVIDASGGGGDRDAIDMRSGRCNVRGGSLSGAAGHCIRIQDGAGRLSIDGTQLLGGVYLYPDSSVGALQLLDVDARRVGRMWPAADPRDVCSELRIRDPLGDVDEYPPRRASGNSGNGGVSGGVRECSWLETEGQRTPIYDIEGDADGPTVAIVGGVHGDETVSHIVAGRFANVVPQQGDLRMIPRAFPDAISKRARGDGYDLNRAFPRDSGPETDLAQALWDAVRDADVVLDLHSPQGIYGTDVASSGNNVGQAVYSTAECADGGADAVAAFNARYISPHRYDEIYKFEHVGNQSDGDGIDSLIRYCGSEGVAGHLIETTFYQIGLEKGVAWMEGSSTRSSGSTMSSCSETRFQRNSGVLESSA